MAETFKWGPEALTFEERQTVLDLLQRLEKQVLSMSEPDMPFYAKLFYRRKSRVVAETISVLRGMGLMFGDKNLPVSVIQSAAEYQINKTEE